MLADVAKPKVKVPTPKDLEKFQAKHGLSKEQLAELLGVSPRAINMWLAGTRKPSKSASLLFKLYEELPEKIKKD